MRRSALPVHEKAFKLIAAAGMLCLGVAGALQLAQIQASAGASASAVEVAATGSLSGTARQASTTR